MWSIAATFASFVSSRRRVSTSQIGQKNHHVALFASQSHFSKHMLVTCVSLRTRIRDTRDTRDAVPHNHDNPPRARAHIPPNSVARVHMTDAASEAVPDHLVCVVCLDAPVGRIEQCANGHLLCAEPCLTQLRAQPGVTKCPTCRKRLAATLSRNLAAEHTIALLPATCRLCALATTRSQLALHEGACPRRLVACAGKHFPVNGGDGSGCQWSGGLDTCAAHEMMCAHAIYAMHRRDMRKARETDNTKSNRIRTLTLTIAKLERTIAKLERDAAPLSVGIPSATPPPDECVCVLDEHTDTVLCLTVDEDNNMLYSGSSDTTIRAWNLAASEPHVSVGVMRGHALGVTCVQVVPIYDDSYPNLTLWSGSLDCTIRLWDLGSYECIHVLTEHTGGVTSLSLLWINWGTCKMCSSSLDKTIRLWTLYPDIVGVDIEIESASVLAVGVATQITFLDWTVFYISNGVLGYFPFDNLCNYGSIRRPLYTNDIAATCVCTTLNPELICTGGSSNGDIAVWNRNFNVPDDWKHPVVPPVLCTQMCLPGHTCLRGHTAAVHSLAIDNGREYVRHIEHYGALFSGSEDHTVRQWDLNMFECVRVLSVSVPMCALSVHECEDSPQRYVCAASGTPDNKIRVWRLPVHTL